MRMIFTASIGLLSAHALPVAAHAEPTKFVPDMTVNKSSGQILAPSSRVSTAGSGRVSFSSGGDPIQIYVPIPKIDTAAVSSIKLSFLLESSPFAEADNSIRMGFTFNSEASQPDSSLDNLTQSAFTSFRGVGVFANPSTGVSVLRTRNPDGENESLFSTLEGSWTGYVGAERNLPANDSTGALPVILELSFDSGLPTSVIAKLGPQTAEKFLSDYQLENVDGFFIYLVNGGNLTIKNLEIITQK